MTLKGEWAHNMNRKPPPYIETRFQVAGAELDPDELTPLVRLQPTASGKKGDLSPKPAPGKQGQTVLEPFWRIEVARDSYSTDEGIQEILSLIWEWREALAGYLKARPSVTAGFTLMVKIIYYRPVYEISLDSLRKLAYLGCDFRIDEVCDLRTSDVYDLGEYESGR